MTKIYYINFFNEKRVIEVKKEDANREINHYRKHYGYDSDHYYGE
ncbi:unnamed protein product [marine sediment metagenome]|uniref:Uncharacterized protein n=1 Tax=marine sediment metagenome TaxID=412755 RepID=X1BHA0_9ZZZZ